MERGFKSVQLNFFIHHFLCDDTYRCLWHVADGWLHMLYPLSFVEGDMFVIWNISKLKDSMNCCIGLLVSRIHVLSSC